MHSSIPHGHASTHTDIARWWLVSVALLLSLVAKAGSAADRYPYDWEGTACAPLIKKWSSEGIADIYRIRPRPSTDTSVVMLEEGDPNRPDVPSSFGVWYANVNFADMAYRKYFMNAVTRGGWIAFRIGSSSKPKGFHQNVYWIDGKTCRVQSSTYEIELSNLPEKVWRFLAEAADFVPDPDTPQAASGNVLPPVPEPRPGTPLNIPQDQIDFLRKTQELMPVPLLARLGQLHSECEALGGSETRLDDDFVTKVDIDGDGDLDYIADGSKLKCNVHGGRFQPFGGNKSGDRFWIVLQTPNGPKLLDDFIGRVVIRNHGSYGSMAFENGLPYRIENNTIRQVQTIPMTGEILFSTAL